MNLIDRDALIECKFKNPISYNAFVNLVKRQTIVNKWIPCSERLPEESGKYLVTVKNGNVYAGAFSAYDNKFQCAATAWMPLPEPYGEEQNDEHD